jgi:hypothetical protein
MRGRVTQAGSRWHSPTPVIRPWPTASSGSCSVCKPVTGPGPPGTCPMARVRCATAGPPSSTQTAGSRGPSGPGPSRSSSGPPASRAANLSCCGRWSPGPPTPPPARWPVTACPVRPWTTGKIRFRSRWERPPRCWPACAPPPTWPPTSAVRQPRAMAAAGRPRRPGWRGRSRRRSARPVISARQPPGRVPMRPSRSSGRLSRCQAPGCCRRPGQHSERSPSPTAACGPAAAGQAPPTSPGPRRPPSSRCSMPPPGSTARRRPSWRGLPRTGRGWARYPSRSTPPASQPRQPRWPGPTR